MVRWLARSSAPEVHLLVLALRFADRCTRSAPSPAARELSSGILVACASSTRVSANRFYRPPMGTEHTGNVRKRAHLRLRRSSREALRSDTPISRQSHAHLACSWCNCSISVQAYDVGSHPSSARSCSMRSRRSWQCASSRCRSSSSFSLTGVKPPLARRRRRSAPASFHCPSTNRPGLFREPGRHDLPTVQRKGRQACSPPWLEKGRTHSTSRQASWLPVIVTGYSCGTALDLHQLPPLCPGIRACGSPRWYLLGKSIKMIAYLHQVCK